MTAPLRKQFELLQQQSEPYFLRRTQIGCLTVLVVIAMAVAFWAVSNRIWGGLFGVVVLLFLAVAIRSSARDAAPHLARARQALTNFEAVAGTVRVVATSDDGTTTYHAGVQDRRGQDWTFSCDPYGGWCPETGDYPAQLRYLPDVPWPVLVVTEQGLLHPGRQPEAKTLLPPPDNPPPTRASVRAGWIVAAVIFLLGCGVLVGGLGRLPERHRHRAKRRRGAGGGHQSGPFALQSRREPRTGGPVHPARWPGGRAQPERRVRAIDHQALHTVHQCGRSDDRDDSVNARGHA